MTAPPEDGDGAQRAMRNALKDAELRPERHRLHQRARHLDAARRPRREHRDQARVRRRTRKKLAVSSTKSMTGHLLGAAGGVEAVFTRAGAPRPGRAADDQPRQRRIPECDLDYVPNDGAQDDDPRARCRTRSASAAPTRHSRFARSERAARTPMALIVQKYGGTSVGIDRPHSQRRRARRALSPRGPPARRRRVGDVGRDQPAARARAASSSTDPNPRELDVIAATGEQVTIGLLAIALQEMGIKARSYTGAQVRDPDRQRAHQGAHPRRSTSTSMRARPRQRQDRRSSPASRASTRTATSRRSAAAARTPRASRSPRR